jgi:translocation protein SEC63
VHFHPARLIIQPSKQRTINLEAALKMSSTDYNYDEQGQFFPFYILTIAGLITFPITYNILKPSTKIENTAPRIQSDFQIKDEDLIQAQKKRQRRTERKTKRIVTVVIGFAVMAYMIYLIHVTARTVPKIWDPYEILGVSRVSRSGSFLR